MAWVRVLGTGACLDRKCCGDWVWSSGHGGPGAEGWGVAACLHRVGGSGVPGWMGLGEGVGEAGCRGPCTGALAAGGGTVAAEHRGLRSSRMHMCDDCWGFGAQMRTECLRRGRTWRGACARWSNREQSITYSSCGWEPLSIILKFKVAQRGSRVA